MIGRMSRAIEDELLRKLVNFKLFTIYFTFIFSVGESSKTLMIVNICPNAANMSETLSSLNFSSRARSTVLSLGNRDTIKKWRDIVSSFTCCYSGYFVLSTCVHTDFMKL